MRGIKTVLLGCLLVTQSANAVVDRVFGLDMSVGMPSLLSMEAQMYALPRFHVGLGLGLISGIAALTPQVTVGPQEIELSDGNTYIYRPDVKTNFFALTPFVRWFPGEDNFYFQFTWALFITRFNVEGSIQMPDGTVIPQTSITGTVDVFHSLPTVSIGHIWLTRLFFVNLSLGATFFGPVSSNVALTTQIPDALGGTAGNEEALEPLKGEINNSANEVTDGIKQTTHIIPSLQLAIGFFF